MKERLRGARRLSLVGSLLAVTAVLASIAVTGQAATGDSVRGSATLNDGGETTITVRASGAADELDATGSITFSSSILGHQSGATVSCLHVDGSDAWIGYTIIRSNHRDIGDESVLVVHDDYPKEHAETGVTADTVRIFVASSPSAAECVDEPIFGVLIFNTYLGGGYTVTEGLERFDFGQVTRNKTNGTAKLTTTVPGPGEVVLARTKQVKGDEAQAAAAGGGSVRTSQNEIEVELTVKPRGKAKKKLNRKGKAKVKAKVTYTPDGSDPTIVGSTDVTTVKLIKR